MHPALVQALCAIVLGLLNPPLWMTREFVQENSDAIDGPGPACKVLLDFFWSGAVIHVADEDAARVNVLPVFSGTALRLMFELTLHLS